MALATPDRNSWVTGSEQGWTTLTDTLAACGISTCRGGGPKSQNPEIHERFDTVADTPPVTLLTELDVPKDRFDLL